MSHIAPTHTRPAFPVGRTMAIVLGIAVVFFVGTCAALLPSALRPSPETTFSDDATAYHNEASNLLLHGVMSNEGVRPETEHEPGYPVFLAMVYGLFGIGNRAAIFIAHALFLAVGAGFFLVEFRRLAGNGAAMLFGVFIVLSPAIYQMIFTPYREIVAVSLMLLVLGSALRWLRLRTYRWAVCCGIALGVLILTYFSFVFLPLLLVPLFVMMKLPRLQILLFGAVCCVLASSILIRNASLRDPSSCIMPGCFRSAIVWHYRAAQAAELTGWKPAVCLWKDYVELTREGAPMSCRLGAVLGARWPQVRGHEMEIRTTGRDAVQWLLAHPFRHAWVSVFWAIEYHFPHFSGWGHAYNLLETLFTALMYVGILCGLFLAPRRREYLLLLVPIVYATLLFALIDVVPRYRMPILGNYIALAAIGAAAMWTRRQSAAS